MAWGLRTRDGMIRMDSNQSRSVSSVRVLQTALTPSVTRRATGPRRRTPARVGLLRLAPRLSVLGERQALEWRAIAGGIGGALEGVVRTAPATVVRHGRRHEGSIPGEWPWGPGADCA
jgi:hypothetical protein